MCNFTRNSMPNECIGILPVSYTHLSVSLSLCLSCFLCLLKLHTLVSDILPALLLLFQSSRLSGLLFLHHATLKVRHAGLQRYRVLLLKISRVPASEKHRLQSQNSRLDSPRINVWTSGRSSAFALQHLSLSLIHICPFFVTRLRLFSVVCWFFWTLCVCWTFVLRSLV